jgi:hypothetical protein
MGRCFLHKEKSMRIGIYFSRIERGPGKVVSNLLKGLDLAGIEYSINSDGERNLILQECSRLNGDLSNCFIGPNICTLPVDNHIVLSQNYLKTIVPSLWVKDLYSRWINPQKISVWPCGIDTDLFNPSNEEKDNDFLIYFKRRERRDLEKIEGHLKSMGKKYSIVEYGNYKEKEFLNILSRSKYGIVVDGCESQGVAIQEMLSCGIPLLVWDSSVWKDRGVENECPATSVPYWDDSCGEIFKNPNEFTDKIDMLISKKYNPRDFILKNLTLKEKSLEILEIIKK